MMCSGERDERTGVGCRPLQHQDQQALHGRYARGAAAAANHRNATMRELGDIVPSVRHHAAEIVPARPGHQLERSRFGQHVQPRAGYKRFRCIHLHRRQVSTPTPASTRHHPVPFCSAPRFILCIARAGRSSPAQRVTLSSPFPSTPRTPTPDTAQAAAASSQNGCCRRKSRTTSVLPRCST
jgi:hypothetical protein